jgi:hypothetical protein
MTHRLTIQGTRSSLQTPQHRGVIPNPVARSWRTVVRNLLFTGRVAGVPHTPFLRVRFLAPCRHSESAAADEESLTAHYQLFVVILSPGKGPG